MSEFGSYISEPSPFPGVEDIILIFDTYGGLCNQMYDIINGINFCLKYNIQFTFRHCAFRNDNLTSWTKRPFEQLFDISMMDEYKLYINYHTIKDNITNDNCHNLNGDQFAHQILKKDNICAEFLEDYAIGFHMPIIGIKYKILNLKTDELFFDFV